MEPICTASGYGGCRGIRCCRRGGDFDNRKRDCRQERNSLACDAFSDSVDALWTHLFDVNPDDHALFFTHLLSVFVPIFMLAADLFVPVH